MLHVKMASITVRVVPRAGRTAVERDAGALVVRVRSAPEGGRATEEAARALALALRVARTSVRLRKGIKSRVKVFEVQGLSEGELARRLRRL